MKRLQKKLTVLLLAACLLLGLAACGEREGGGSEQISGTIYVPSFASITSDAEYIYQGCADNEYFYFLGQVPGEAHEETYTWYDENGEEHTETYTNYDYQMKLFRVPLAGGTAEALSSYEPTPVPDGMEGSVDVGNLRAGPDGSLLVTENMYTYSYDLPEDFNEETGSMWEYQTGQTNTVIVRKLDSSGAELESTNLSGLEEKAGVEFIYNTLIDNSGNIYVTSESKIAVLDKDMNLLFTLEEERMYGEPVILGDGTVGLRRSYYDEEKEASGTRLQVIDLAAKGWGTSYELSQSAYGVYTGGGDYLFYYLNGDSVYGQKADGTGEKIFSWISANIDRDMVQVFTFLADGRVAALTRNWEDESIQYESAVLTPTDASTLPAKTTLTYACMGLGYDVRNKIIEFNKTSDLYRIEVQDYAEYNTGEDTTAGLTKLNTEVLAGRVPDIMEAGSSMPISQYGSKGLLEDLWPYIENDEEIGGRAGVMENALKAAEQNGKLYQIFSMFDIRTVVGSTQVVGERTSWTLADLQAAFATMPEGGTIFGESDTKEYMLNNILSCNIDNFVDWSTGSCNFNGDSFKSLLEFCNSFPEDFDWDNVNWDEYESDDTRIYNGKQMLKFIYLDSFSVPQLQKGMFGGDISFVGYPMEDGSIGSSFQPMGSYSFAMSSTSKDKDGVWSFIREALLPQLEEEYWINDFPINRKDFERYMNDSMTIKYILDENGQQILDENGEPMKETRASWWIDDNNRIEVYSATQEEVDQVMDLYNSITSIWRFDDNIFKIVEENAGPYFAGDKTLEDTVNLIQSAVKLYIGEQM